MKRILFFLSFIISTLLFAQKDDSNLLDAEFTYRLKSKTDIRTSYMDEENFLLQIEGGKGFFASENLIKNDSLRKGDIVKAMATVPKGGTINYTASGRVKTKYNYAILQSATGIEYLEKIDGQLFSYQEPKIQDWMLVNEDQFLNGFNCKKASLNYKGRLWTAWYTPEIPFPYGPYKFIGLPGLIIKMESQEGDYSFELIRSTPKNKLNGKVLSLKDTRYKNPKTATSSQMREFKKNTIERLVTEASNMGIDTSNGGLNDLRERQKQRMDNFLNENQIEKTEN